MSKRFVVFVVLSAVSSPLSFLCGKTKKTKERKNMMKIQQQSISDTIDKYVTTMTVMVLHLQYNVRYTWTVM